MDACFRLETRKRRLIRTSRTLSKLQGKPLNYGPCADVAKRKRAFRDFLSTNFSVILRTFLHFLFFFSSTMYFVGEKIKREKIRIEDLSFSSLSRIIQFRSFRRAVSFRAFGKRKRKGNSLGGEKGHVSAIGTRRGTNTHVRITRRSYRAGRYAGKANVSKIEGEVGAT